MSDDLDLERIPVVFEMLFARSNDDLRERVLDISTRNPGCLHVRRTDDPETLELTLIDRERDGEVTVLGSFPLAELRPLDEDELAANAESRQALMTTAAALGAAELEPGFPAIVSDGFRELAIELLEQIGSVSEAAFGAPLSNEALEEFETGFRRDGLELEAEGMRRVRAWMLDEHRRQAARN